MEGQIHRSHVHKVQLVTVSQKRLEVQCGARHVAAIVDDRSGSRRDLSTKWIAFRCRCQGAFVAETMLPDGLGEAGKIWPNVGP